MARLRDRYAAQQDRGSDKAADTRRLKSCTARAEAGAGGEVEQRLARGIHAAQLELRLEQEARLSS